MSQIVLQTKSIVKNFPGVRALDGVDIEIMQGEVHAIVGENGAGKTTLMMILAGAYHPDEGEIYLRGEKVVFNSSIEASKKGIGIVHQELSLVPNLSVAENIFANRQPIKALGIIDLKKLRVNTLETLSLFGINSIDPDCLVKNLSIANQQLVEILKAISTEPKLLILDEPTSSLTDAEVKQLFKNIRILKNRGISFIYISHHLNEIFEIADNVTILRDGRVVANAKLADVNEEYLITNMVGREIKSIYGKREIDAEIGNIFFEAKSIRKKGVFEDVSFYVRKGEIVGFSGLVGAGRTDVGRSIFGADPIDNGELYLNEKKIKIDAPKQAIEYGIGYMTEDRKVQGLYLAFDVKSNLIANRLKDFTSFGFLNEKKIDDNAYACVEEFCVVTPSPDQIISKLSGGNQQKVLLSMWFSIKPKLFIADEPTKGVDIGAKSDIYNLLRQLAKTGVAVIVISSDLLEILGISDRIYVMKEGRIVGELNNKEANEEKVISLATGVEYNSKECQ